MSKVLILVRHSRPESRVSSFKDFERSLTNEGISDSDKMARFLLDSGIIPDFILTSAAKRAIETSRIFAKTLKIVEKNIKSTRDLYYSSANSILDQINGLSDTVNCLMIIAHNPGISELSNRLSSGRAFYLENTQVSLLEYEIDSWSRIKDEKPLKFKSITLEDIG
jgi:phosphohistidine phosphatase